MNQSVLDYVVEKTRALIEAPTCSKETKEAAQNWLKAVGTSQEKAQTREYLSELEEDIMPIGNLIAFAQSESGVSYFGAERAAGIASHAEEVQAAGGKYCDCPACQIVEKILEHKSELLGE